MPSNTRGSILLSTAENVGTILKKKLSSPTGFSPSEWADAINLLGALPVKTASGAIAHFTDGADAVPLKSSKFYITPTQASGTPTPLNPLPISGHTGLTVKHTGTNIIPSSNVCVTVSRNDLVFDKAILVKKGVTYSCSISNVQNATNWRFAFRFYDGQGNNIINAITNGYVTFTPALADTYDSGRTVMQGAVSTITSLKMEVLKDCFVTVGITSGDVSGSTTLDYQLEVGSTATAYAPYTATTYPVSWSENGTVYGGYFKDGELWKTLHKTTPNEDFTFVIDSQTSSICTIYFAFGINNLPTGKNGGTCVSNRFSKTIPSGTAGRMVLTGNQIYMVLPKSDSSTWTTTEVKQWFEDNTTDICYELATPVKVADLEEVEINSLLGVNNIWCDTGDCEVEYRADIDLLITSLGG